MFQKNIGLAGGMAPVRQYLPELLELVQRRDRPRPGLRPTLPLDEVAEGYRAMDERARHQGPPRAVSVRGSARLAVLGPLLRYVDATLRHGLGGDRATPAEVAVEAGDRHRPAPATFAVHGHHYALVEVTGLEPGTPTPYRVRRRRRAGLAAGRPRRSPSSRRR